MAFFTVNWRSWAKVGEEIVDSGATSRDVLIRLLRLSGQFPLFKSQTVGHRLRPYPLLEVFIAAFFDEVADLARGGLMRRYQEHEEDLRFLRGRILPDRQFAVLANRRDVIACRFDDLTADNPWNRVVKAAIWAVRPWILSFEVQRRCSELLAVFDEVSDIEAPRMVLDALVPDRQAVRYRSAIQWVEWILSLLSPALRAGAARAPGLLCDMDKLFESAVASVLRRRAGPGVEVLPQCEGVSLARIKGPESLDAFGLRPDLLIRSGKSIVGIGDTKWKGLEATKAGYLVPSSDDAYQMQAYATAFRCQKLALIYPGHAACSAAKDTVFELKGGALLTVVCLDLSDDRLTPMRGAKATGFEGLFG